MLIVGLKYTEIVPSRPKTGQRYGHGLIELTIMLLRYIDQRFPAVQGLLDKKSTKNLVSTGVARFNANPKSGLVFLEENRLIYADPDVPRPQSLAEFLKNCARIDKRILGDFISKPDNLDVLEAFIGLFDFKSVRAILHFIWCRVINVYQKGVAEALRELLETFRLPGESQQIARITNTFANHFMTYEPGTPNSVIFDLNTKLMRLS